MYLRDVSHPLDTVLELPRTQYRELDDYKTQMQELFIDATVCTRQALLSAQRQTKILLL